MSQTTTNGILLRLVEPKDEIGLDATIAAPNSPCPNIEKTYAAVASDREKPSFMNLYVLSDITPLITSQELFDQDVKANSSQIICWIVCRFINGRDKGASTTESPSTSQPLSFSPAAGSVLVINGSTPRPDKQGDYHDWYNIEHGPALATVEGWNAGRRYSFVKSYGETQTAGFYGLNYYDENSGLGGSEWQKATKTEWTFRIRGNAEKPNIRRVWRIQESL
ncbi:hypothetical protein VTL71DRAFT_1628 [Oculimacula yallundae]|uniref:Uncharacterized protein n=1 Tax=Oculimacula yallundae TaxID=86028 RepID=A0ABR4CDC8_9HELO